MLTSGNTHNLDLSASRDALGKIKSCILLGGLVRPTPFSEAIERSFLDLPLAKNYSVLDQWRDQANHLVEALGHKHLPVRVLVDLKSVLPTTPENCQRTPFSIERDKTGFRGTGGVLHDQSSQYHENDLVLVANASQMLLRPLPQLVDELAILNADVAIVSHNDGTPSGLMLVRCGVLRSISPIGFVDMKEQALPKIAENHQVKVLQKSQATGLPIRNPYDYIKVLQYRANLQDRSSVIPHEDWRSSFGIIEPDAEIDSSAHVHDSVVLRHARVDKGARLIRSIACPGAQVMRRNTVIDQVITRNKSKKKRN